MDLHIVEESFTGSHIENLLCGEFLQNQSAREISAQTMGRETALSSVDTITQWEAVMSSGVY